MDVLSGKKKPLCGICNVKEFRYTCPKCNVPYCSVDCYKNESHLNCSEEFYKECVMKQLAAHRAETSASGGDADLLSYLKTELAKREEDASLFDGDDQYAAAVPTVDADGDDDDEEEEDDLPLDERLANVNLDTADPETILQCLTSTEREEFESILQDPGKQAALVSLWTPWWQQQTKTPTLPKTSRPGSNCLTADQFSSLPHLSQLSKVKPSDLLPCNLANILMAYCCSLRLYNGDLDVDCVLEVCSVLSSNAVFETVEDAIVNAISTCTQSCRLSLSLGFCSTVAHDVLCILTAAKRPVAELDVISAPLYALAHLYNALLVERDTAKADWRKCPKSDDTRSKDLKSRYDRLRRIPDKLYFSLVWAKSCYRDWRLLSDSVQAQADDLAMRVAEAEEQKGLATASRHFAQESSRRGGNQTPANTSTPVLIQETGQDSTN
eukprot:scpid20919/ scgid27595/ Zinc finger HIT domain-containing protein 2